MAKRVALSVPVEVDGATYEFLMPDADMAEVLPAALGLLMGLPGDAQAALIGGEMTQAATAQLGMLLLQPDLLRTFAAGFDAGVIEWQGVEAADGSPLACSDKNKRYIPLFDKLLAVLAFVGTQQVLAAKKEPATLPPTSASPLGSPEGTSSA